MPLMKVDGFSGSFSLDDERWLPLLVPWSCLLKMEWYRWLLPEV